MSRAQAVAAGAAALALLAAGAACRQSAKQGRPPAAAARATPLAPPELAALLGNWVRPDGGYVMSISGVAPDGTATVSYFNPKPIRVARAEVVTDGGRVSLLVRFDDVNYPGSTYTLAYDRASDSLRGDYFQAVQGAHYDVVFVRQR